MLGKVAASVAVGVYNMYSATPADTALFFPESLRTGAWGVLRVELCPPIFTSGSPNPQVLRIGLYLERTMLPWRLGHMRP